MPRYLTLSQIESALNREKSVEQFLGSSEGECIAWLEMRPSTEGVELWHYEVFDDGDENAADLYSFAPTGEGWPEMPVSHHETFADALRAAQQNHGASNERWVNQSVIQDEYLDYRETKK